MNRSDASEDVYESERVERELSNLRSVIDRLTRANLSLPQIESFERLLHRGHRSNLLKIERIIGAAKGWREE